MTPIKSVNASWFGGARQQPWRWSLAALAVAALASACTTTPAASAPLRQPEPAPALESEAGTETLSAVDAPPAPCGGETSTPCVIPSLDVPPPGVPSEDDNPYLGSGDTDAERESSKLRRRASATP